MGQRFIPDSRMLQELTYPKVGIRINRDFPAWGWMSSPCWAARVPRNLLDNVYQQTQYAHYLTQRAKLQQEIRN